MRLYIVRHGAAEPHNPGGDFKRSLTPEGEGVLRKTAKFLDRKIQPDTFITSPFLRAKQTAALFAQVLGFSGSIDESPAFTPGTDVEETIDFLDVHGGKETIVFGHNPHLSDLVAVLVSNGSLYFDMKKAAVVRIDFEGGIRAGGGELKWAVSPSLLE